MNFGMCYYPEYYKLSEADKMISEDIDMLKEMNMDVVRIAEFTWCLIEPEEGVYEFDWLDKIVNKLGSAGIKSIICTPTVAPPLWLGENYPEIYFYNADGSSRKYGGRHYACLNNPKYLDACEKIVGKIAERYADNEYVLGFQADNEIGQERNERCFCDTCKKKFRTWAKNKYSDIDVLNSSWGTLFWGQRYASFDQIIPPVTYWGKNPLDREYYLGVDNPSLRLDYARFCSDTMVEFFEMQNRIIKKYTDKPVMTNATCIEPGAANYEDMFKNADVYASDYYPVLNFANKAESAFHHAFSRGVKNNPFWVMETYAGGGQGNWAYHGIEQGKPGTYANNIVHAYACGAELITAFKFHVFKSGYEQLGSALIDADRKKRRRFYEFKRAGSDMRSLEHIIENTFVKADTAILYSYDSLWSMQAKPIHDEFGYNPYILKTYSALKNSDIEADVIFENSDFDKYKMIVLPCCAIMSSKLREKIRRYVRGGGCVAATFLTSSKNANANAETAFMPYGLTDLFGMNVGEVDMLTENNGFKFEISGHESDAKIWLETLETNTAEAVGMISSGYKSGECCISKNEFGRGYAYYIGTDCNDKAFEDIISTIAENADVKRLPIHKEYGIEIVVRENEAEKYCFIFNNNDEEKNIEIDFSAEDMFNSESVCGLISLPPISYRVLKIK